MTDGQNIFLVIFIWYALYFNLRVSLYWQMVSIIIDGHYQGDLGAILVALNSFNAVALNSSPTYNWIDSLRVFHGMFTVLTDDCLLSFSPNQRVQSQLCLGVQILQIHKVWDGKADPRIRTILYKRLKIMNRNDTFKLFWFFFLLDIVLVKREASYV